MHFWKCIFENNFSKNALSKLQNLFTAKITLVHTFQNTHPTAHLLACLLSEHLKVSATDLQT